VDTDVFNEAADFNVDVLLKLQAAYYDFSTFKSSDTSEKAEFNGT
jgi:hypothetical protein